MNSIKKIVAVLTAIVVAVSMGALCVSAEDVYGTEAEGIVGNNRGFYMDGGYTTTNLQNGDFSQGLKYWGDYAGDKKAISAGGTVSTDGGFLTFTADKDQNYTGIGSAPFFSSKYVAGKYLTAVFKFKTSDADYVQFNLTQRGSDTAEFKGGLFWLENPGIDGWGVATIAISEVEKNHKPIADLAGYPHFWFAAQVTSKNVSFSIDDIKIVVDNGNGTYTDTVTDQVLSYTNNPYATGGQESGGQESGGQQSGGQESGGQQSGGQESGGQQSGGQESGGQGTGTQTESDIYGTKEDGLSLEKGKIWSYTTATPIQNLDFSQGFRYWSGHAGTGGKASDYATLKNGVVTLKGVKQYDGIQTVPFTDSRIKMGDKLTLIFEWKGECPKLGLNQNNGQKGWLCNSNESLLVAGETDEDWNIAVLRTIQPVHELKDDSTEPMFSINIQTLTSGVKNYNVRNIQLCKVSDDGRYFTLDGKELTESNNFGISANGTIAGSDKTGDNTPVLLLTLTIIVAVGCMVILTRKIKA